VSETECPAPVGQYEYLTGRAIDSTPEQVAERSRRLLRAERGPETLALMEAAGFRYRQHADSRMQRGDVLVALEREGAAEEFEESVRLDPDNPERLARVAYLIFELGTREQARAFAARARELAPRDLTYRWELESLDGKLAFIRGDYEAAERALRGAAEAETRRPILRPRSRVLLGRNRS
jgi:tetratricopeptide (TPR) repeat protein